MEDGKDSKFLIMLNDEMCVKRGYIHCLISLFLFWSTKKTMWEVISKAIITTQGPEVLEQL